MLGTGDTLSKPRISQQDNTTWVCGLGYLFLLISFSFIASRMERDEERLIACQQVRGFEFLLRPIFGSEQGQKLKACPQDRVGSRGATVVQCTHAGTKPEASPPTSSRHYTICARSTAPHQATAFGGAQGHREVTTKNGTADLEPYARWWPA